ncbi:MAG: prephenate dehydrogenase/arogenate dehydrogenase family protein, partial [Brevundimonas sp.]
MSTGRPDKMRLGLIGYGAFGRLAAQGLSPHFEIVAYDPAGEGLASLAEAAACPIVMLAVPVHAVAETVAAIAPLVRPDALVLDVGSVKVAPTRAMDQGLPPGVEVVGLHP